MPLLASQAIGAMGATEHPAQCLAHSDIWGVFLPPSLPLSCPTCLELQLSAVPPPAIPPWLLRVAGHLLTWLLTPGKLWVSLLSNPHVFVFLPLEKLMPLAPWEAYGRDGARSSHVHRARASSTAHSLRLSPTLLNRGDPLRPGPSPAQHLTSDIFDPRWHNFSPKCECICELMETSSLLW